MRTLTADRTCQHAALAILLPASSAGLQNYASQKLYAERLCSHISPVLYATSAVRVILGMDELDPARLLVARAIAQDPVLKDKVTQRTFYSSILAETTAQSFKAFGIGCKTSVGSQAQAAPICWMWAELARLAVHRHGADYLVLLGDDTEVLPDHWVQLVLGQCQFHS